MVPLFTVTTILYWLQQPVEVVSVVTKVQTTAGLASTLIRILQEILDQVTLKEQEVQEGQTEMRVKILHTARAAKGG